MHTHTAMSFISENYRVLKEYRNLVELVFAVFVSMLGFGLIMPLFPLYADQFGATKFELGILTSLFALTRLLTSYPAGHFMDKIGRKRIITFGLFVYAINMFLFGEATQLWHLYALRALQGAASGVVWPTATVMAADIVRFEDRGKAMGIFSMSWDLGMAFGPFIGGIISDLFSMAYSFYVCSIMAFISAVLILIRVKETVPHAKSEEIVVREKLTPYKTILIGLCIAAFTTAFGMGLTITMLSIYAKEILGLSVAAIGIIFGFRGITRLFIKPITGDLSDKYGKRIFLILGRTLSSLGTMLITLANGFFTLSFSVIFAALGTGMGMPASDALVTSIAYKETRGKVMGIYSTLRNLGLLVGPLVGGWIYENIDAKTPFILCGLVGFVGVIALFFTIHDPEKIE